MKIAISGKTGVIGGALAASLRMDGHDVLSISRRPGPDTVVWDLEEETLPSGALDGVDAVVHLAGETIDGRWTAKKKRRLVGSRVRSTQLLAAACVASDQPPLVYVGGSAMGAYGDRGDDLLAETEVLGSTFLAGLVGQWEEAAEPMSAAGIRVVHARTSLVLDSASGALKRMALITRLFAGGRLGSGHQYWSWITLADEVRALRHLIDNELEGPFNLATSSPVTQLEFAATLARALHRPAVVPAPAFAIRLVLGQMGEELLLTSARLDPARLLDSGFEFEYDELGPALDVLYGRGQ